MAKAFVITGLPRSGTAWIAMLLNLHTGVFCYHDAVATAATDSYADALSIPGFKAVGDSSSAAMAPAFDDLVAERIFIHRDEEQCRESLHKVMGDLATPAFEAARIHAVEWIHKFNPTMINYDYLFEANRLSERENEAAMLVETATGLPFNKRAWDFARHLNVQIEGLSPTYYEGKKLITHL